MAVGTFSKFGERGDHIVSREWYAKESIYAFSPFNCLVPYAEKKKCNILKIIPKSIFFLASRPDKIMLTSKTKL